MHRNKKNTMMRQKMKKRLKDEAGRSRPDFSPALHRRIMRTVAKCEPAGRNNRRMSGTLWLLATAATVMLVAGAAGTWLANSPAIEHTAKGVTPENPSPAQVSSVSPTKSQELDVTGELYFSATRGIDEAQQVDVLVESMLADEQVALLNHDARLAADWVLNPLKLAFAEN